MDSISHAIGQNRFALLYPLKAYVVHTRPSTLLMVAKKEVPHTEEPLSANNSFFMVADSQGEVSLQ